MQRRISILLAAFLALLACPGMWQAGVVGAAPHSQASLPSGSFTDGSTGIPRETPLGGEILVGFVDNSYAPPGAEHLFGTVYLVRVEDVGLALSNWVSRTGVRFAEPNGLVELLDETPKWWDRPNDLGTAQWALYNERDTDIDYVEMWNIYDGPRRAVIAILDTGLYFEHQDAPHLWSNEGEIPDNDIDDDGNGYVDDYHGANTADHAGRGANTLLADLHGHGTHVSGIAAATNNGLGIAGVYPNGPIMVVKVFPGSSGSTTWDTVISGIIYAADNGANIISMSLGGTDKSQALHEAVQYAWEKGALIVAAAGNTGRQGILYPAAFAEVVAVGATNIRGNRASFSSYGEGLEVVAPGVNIWSSAPPWAYCSMDNPDNPGNQYCNMSGTSMATPHVSGAAALVWSKSPRLTNEEVQNKLIENTDDIGPRTGWDKETGWGRVNLSKALSPQTVNLVCNPSFEEGMRCWRPINFDENDKVVSSGFTGGHSLKLTNAPGESVKVQQRIKARGGAGNIIIVGAHSDYYPYLEGKYPIRIRIVYRDGTKERYTLWIRRRGDTAGWVCVETAFVAQKRYKAITIRLVNVGKWKMPVRFDDISLHIMNT